MKLLDQISVSVEDIVRCIAQRANIDIFHFLQIESLCSSNGDDPLAPMVVDLTVQMVHPIIFGTNGDPLTTIAPMATVAIHCSQLPSIVEPLAIQRQQWHN